MFSNTSIHHCFSVESVAVKNDFSKTFPSLLVCYRKTFTMWTCRNIVRRLRASKYLHALITIRNAYSERSFNYFCALSNNQLSLPFIPLLLAYFRCVSREALFLSVNRKHFTGSISFAYWVACHQVTVLKRARAHVIYRESDKASVVFYY